MAKKDKSAEKLQAERDALLAETKGLQSQEYELNMEANMLEAEIIGLIELNIATLNSRLAFFHEALTYHREKMKDRVKVMELAKIPQSYRTRLPLTALQDMPVSTASDSTATLN